MSLLMRLSVLMFPRKPQGKIPLGIPSRRRELMIKWVLGNLDVRCELDWRGSGIIQNLDARCGLDWRGSEIIRI
jgi:hypothetical protein